MSMKSEVNFFKLTWDPSPDDFRFILEDDILFITVFVVCVTSLSISIDDGKIQTY